MVKSVIIITDSNPVGKNSAVEAIRLGSGFMGLGEDITCKIVFRGDAILTLSKTVDPTKLGMNSFAEHIEMYIITWQFSSMLIFNLDNSVDLCNRFVI